MATFNRDPYYDDFDAKKNYVKILFKPGVAVQARELTQLQTAIQEQIKTVGGVLFKNESLVTGGESKTFQVSWVDVSTEEDLSGYVGLNMVAGTSGAKIQVLSYKNQVSQGVGRLYFVYKNGQTIGGLDPLTEDSVAPTVGSLTTTDAADNTGMGMAFTISESVFYVNGYFVVCSEQTAVISDNLSPSVKIGLAITEDVATYQEDETLLDPATGTYNYAAPGADRVRISLDLTTHAYDPVADSDAATMQENTEDNFIELARYSGGTLIKSLKNPTLGSIEDTLARRTYDESGDYTVREFKAICVDNIKRDSEKLSIAIDPGKAYVKGYEFETTSRLHMDIDKSREYNEVNNFFAEAAFGEYFVIQHPVGTGVSYTDNPAVYLFNSSDVQIGRTRINYVKRHSNSELRIYVHNTSFTEGSILDVTKIKNAQTSATWVADVNAAPAGGKNKQFLIPTNRSPIKAITDVSYVSQIKSASTATSTTITGTTLPSGKTYPSSNPEDYVVVRESDGVTVTGFTVSSSGGNSFVLSGSFTPGNHSVYAKIAVSSPAVKPKTRTQKTVYTSIYTNEITLLGVSDVYRVLSIQAAKSDDSVPRIDVTARYSLNRGQLDNQYDYGSISLLPGQTAPAAPYDRLVVSLEYFDSTQTAGYFSIDSYDTDATNPSLVVAYEDIPSFVDSTGKSVSLRDVIDFRPKRSPHVNFATQSLASPITNTKRNLCDGSEFIEPYSFLTADLEYYISRIDKLIITKEKKFDVIKGISSDQPQIPSDIPDAMTIYTAFVPAYTFSAQEVRLEQIDNRRYTMRDIGKIEKRVDRLEYYTSMSLLEKQAADETITNSAGIDKFKNGILVDPFAGHSVGDVGSSDYSCSIDSLTRTLRPKFTSESFNFEVDLGESSASNYAKNDDLVTLPFSTEAYVTNNQATGWAKINPYSVYSWDGEVRLNPASDTWHDVTVRPEVTSNLNGVNDAFTNLANAGNPGSAGMTWSAWQTISKGINFNSISSPRQKFLQDGGSISRAIADVTATPNAAFTTKINETSYVPLGAQYELPSSPREVGSKVVDSSVMPYIRSRVIDFSATKLKPNTTLFASFDGVDVTTYCTQAPAIFTTTLAKATRVRKIATSKAADVILLRADRAYVKMDAGQEPFSVGESVEWLVNNVWMTGSDITQTTPQVDDRITTDENGDVAGYFYIPNDANNRFLAGERAFRLADSLGKQPSTAAETKYVCHGLSMPTQKNLVATRIPAINVMPTFSLAKLNTSFVSAISQVSSKLKNALVKAGETVGGSGGTGRHVFDIDFGTFTGECGINYDAFGVPDRYTIIWNGRTYTSGFRGKAGLLSNRNHYNNQLHQKGFPSISTTIDENNPESGKLRFNKTSSYPTKAQLIVDAPLSGTRWKWKAVNPTKTDDLTNQEDPRLTVLVDAPSSTITSFRSEARGSAMQTSSSGVDYNFDVRVDGNQSIPKGTPIRISSMTRAETTNGRWASLASGSRFFVNGRPATFPFNTMTGETITFTISSDLTNDAKEHGLDAGGSLNNPISTLTVTAELIDPIGGLQYTTTGSDTVVHTTSYERYEKPAPSQIAQTFFVSAKENPDGIFVDSVDLFFRSKDSFNIPVSIQIRTVDNGYPSSKTVLPFATGEVMSADIVTSSDASVSKAATRVEFKAPVYLAPDSDYAFVIQANSDKFEVFTSKVGETLLSNAAVRCTKQPLSGSLFFSQNSTDWSVSQSEDLVFRLQKCVFETDSEKPVVLNAEVPSILKNGSSVEFDTLFIDGEVLDFANTNVDYSYKASREVSGVFSIDSSWNNYQLGSNVAMAERKGLSLQDPTSLRVQCTLKSSSRDVSPVIDLNRLSAVLIKNIINNNANGEDAETRTEIQSIQATTSVVTVTTVALHGYSAGDVVFVNPNTTSEVGGTVVITAIPSTTTFAYDRFDGGAAIPLTTQGGTITRSGQALSRYITRKVTLNSDFYSSDIKVHFSGNIPSECSVLPYYRVTTLTDPLIDDNPWIPMVMESTGNRNSSGFSEYKYKAPYVVGGDDVATPSGERFSTFSVKLVLISTETTKVPLVKDLRVMALDD